MGPIVQRGGHFTGVYQCDVIYCHSLTAKCFNYFMLTLGLRQSKMLFTTDEGRSKITRNSVFDCHLSPAGRQMTIKNSVSSDF